MMALVRPQLLWRQIAAGLVVASHMQSVMQLQHPQWITRVEQYKMKNVAVIGAGVSGLVAIKECMENGLLPTCFEQDDVIGGLWYYTKDKRPNQGAASFNSLTTNASKETMCFSDFPFADHYPQFMSHKLYHQYLNEYANHFDVKKHIKFNTQVKSVCKTDDYAVTGRWNIVTQKGDKEESHTFDAVFLCNGGHRKPFYPTIKGMEKFRGQMMHMADYRLPDIFKEKSVLVIGNQHSAGDVAADAAYMASKVYLSVGNGAWFMTRIGPGGHPRDIGAPYFITRNMPLSAQGSVVIKNCIEGFDHQKFGIKDGGNPRTNGYIGVNDEIPSLITSKRIIALSKVKSFTKNGVQLDDGTTVGNLDLVLFATGFLPDYSYVECEDIQGECIINLYKRTFPMCLAKATLAVMSGRNIQGPFQAACEVPCRWAAMVFAGKCQLPSQVNMRKDIEKWHSFFKRECGGKTRVNSRRLAAEIAIEGGFAPCFWKILLKDPLLVLKVYLGSELPVHYRLIGPGSKPEAWIMAHDAYDRLVIELRKSNIRITVKFFLKLIMLVLGLTILYYLTMNLN